MTGSSTRIDSSATRSLESGIQAGRGDEVLAVIARLRDGAFG
ncbi:MAG TPA: hypothetical protein VGO48_11430 [Conexibacter sp.]|nr:hypothetical protein [Conexibacter sp.]